MIFVCVYKKISLTIEPIWFSFAMKLLIDPGKVSNCQAEVISNLPKKFLQKVANYLKVQKVDYKITCIYHAIFGTSFVLKFLYLRNICSMSIFLLFCFDLIFLTSGYNQSGTWCRGRSWILHPPCPFFF